MIFLVIFLYTLHHRPFLSFFVLFPGSKKDEKDEKDVEDEKGQGVFLTPPPPLGIGARRVKTTRQLAQIRPTTRPFFLGELFFFGIFYGYKNTGT